MNTRQLGGRNTNSRHLSLKRAWHKGKVRKTVRDSIWACGSEYESAPLGSLRLESLTLTAVRIDVVGFFCTVT